MRSNFLTVILAAFALIIVGAAAMDVSLPLIVGDREALIALAVVGFVMCATGPLSGVAKKGAWLSYSGILGSLLGMVALVLVGGILLGVELPLISSGQNAFFALAVIVFVKLGVGILHRFMGRLGGVARVPSRP